MSNCALCCIDSKGMAFIQPCARVVSPFSMHRVPSSIRRGGLVSEGGGGVESRVAVFLPVDTESSPTVMKVNTLESLCSSSSPHKFC